MSFIEDCPDEAVAGDVLEALARLLPPSEAAAAPVAAALHRAGGLGLVAPLLRRPRQSLRVVGLRILAALLPRITDPTGDVTPSPTAFVIDHLTEDARAYILTCSISQRLLLVCWHRVQPCADTECIRGLVWPDVVSGRPCRGNGILGGRPGGTAAVPSHGACAQGAAAADARRLARHPGEFPGPAFLSRPAADMFYVDM